MHRLIPTLTLRFLLAFSLLTLTMFPTYASKPVNLRVATPMEPPTGQSWSVNF